MFRVNFVQFHQIQSIPTEVMDVMVKKKRTNKYEINKTIKSEIIKTL
jgi:hypothetical protein